VVEIEISERGRPLPTEASTSLAARRLLVEGLFQGLWKNTTFRIWLSREPT